MTKYDLTMIWAEGKTEKGLWGNERCYPKVGVGQILKQYFNTSAV